MMFIFRFPHTGRDFTDSPKQNNMAAIRKKLVIVGDCDCGKTRLLTVFSKDQFPGQYELTIETYVADIEVDSKQARCFYLSFDSYIYVVMLSTESCKEQFMNV